MTLQQIQQPIFYDQHEIDYSYWIKKYWYTYGKSIEEKNKEKVFCMSGMFEDGHQFNIPQEKAIMTSPIKFIAVTTRKDFETLRDKESYTIPERCKYEIDIIEDLSVFLDKELVSPFLIRERSEFFEIYDIEINKWVMAMCEGYWLIIKPYALDKGVHQISSFSSCKLGQVQVPQNISINII